jgi:hypothetical protein
MTFYLGSSYPRNCPDGTRNLNVGQPTISSCEPCPRGRYCHQGSDLGWPCPGKALFLPFKFLMINLLYILLQHISKLAIIAQILRAPSLISRVQQEPTLRKLC